MLQKNSDRRDRYEIIVLASVVGIFLIVIVLLLVCGGKPVVSPKRTVYAPAQPREQYEFPAGGRRLLPDYRFVALYGTPGEPVLGALGAQDLSAGLERVKALAAQYRPLMTEHVYPTFEIITTVASASPTENGDYSRQIDVSRLELWIVAAQKQGVYVVLDLQPGRTDFLTQAKQYQKLLEYPNVGLALDPEWRLGPTQVPLEQIGSVGIDEVNATIGWLAGVTATRKLPQKLVVLHEFRTDMLPERQRLDTSHPEIACIIQMDGQGTQSVKLDTWRAVTTEPPAGVYFGWKNFYDKDSPVLDVAGTMALRPEPWYVSYQ